MINLEQVQLDSIISSINSRAKLASPTFTGNVSGITKAMVGLGNVDNTTDLLKPLSTATITALALKAPLASPTFTGTVSGITKAMVGLGNVDNTTDLAKPISTATQTALNGKLSTGQLLAPMIGVNNSMNMLAGDSTNNGSFTCRGTGTGDANLAGMSFYNDVYAIKLGVRADGYFGLGGWSRTAWSWYSDPSGNMVAAGNVTAYSDPRLKDNIRKIEKPMDILNSLDGVRYVWNERSKLTEAKWGKEDIGILADQVKAVLPEIVSASIKDEENGEVYDTVDYGKLVPVLIEAIKAQQVQIDQLVNDITVLKG
jgi:hypothetical protein